MIYTFPQLKNPAYGRHQISRPMLIEAPIQKKTYKGFSSYLGDLVKRGWAAVHSTAEHRSKFYQLNYTALLFYAVHFTEIFKNIWSFNSQQFNSLDFIELHCIANF